MSRPVSRQMGSTPQYDRQIDQVVAALGNCQSVLFITGAGISADSGLPTYRGVGGLYEVGHTADGLRVEEVLSGHTFRRNPELTWKYLLQIERACRGARANRGHEVIVEMEQHFDRVWTLTQNVDGFHRQAGSENLIEIHGNLHELGCTGCAHRERVADYSHLPDLPVCSRCHAVLRPDVVLFGEMLPDDKVRTLFDELGRGFDVIFSIGTTSVFPYIAEPIERAVRKGKMTVEINPGETEVSRLVAVKISDRAAPALDRIWRRYRKLTG